MNFDTIRWIKCPKCLKIIDIKQWSMNDDAFLCMECGSEHGGLVHDNLVYCGYDSVMDNYIQTNIGNVTDTKKIFKWFEDKQS